MKKVLAELHQLINSLEDHGLTAEASSLQEVFVRVAQKADPNDLSEKVTDLLGKYSAPELIAALAEQMDSKDTKTMSFAFGDTPAGYGNESKDVIVNEFVSQAKKKDMRQADAYFMMNQRLQSKGHTALTEKEFLAKVNSSDTNSSDTNVSEFAFGDKPDGTESGELKPTYMNHPIVENYVDLVSRYKMDKEEAYTKMNEELLANGQKPFLRSAFDGTVYNHRHMISTINYKGPNKFDGRNMSPEEFRRYQDETWGEMTERHNKMPYGSPAHQSAR